MSKITRQTFIQFGVNVNAAADICQFGSPATGSPVYTNVISVLQSLAAWTTGFAAETIANNRPFLEDFNAFCYVFSYMIAYILEMGIPEWDAGTNYFTNSIVQSGGIVYQSLIDNNLNITPVVGASWKLLQKGLGAWTTITPGFIYQATTDGVVLAQGNVSAPSGNNIAIFTDSIPSPITLRQICNTSADLPQSISCPVRKGDYYTIDYYGGYTGICYFISNGN